jgi:hypothetical protein
MTLENYRGHCQKVAKYVSKTKASKVVPPPHCCHNNKVLNKRRGRMRHRDIKHGCDPDKTMRLGVFRDFLKTQGECHYCGGCPTGLDRRSRKQCYTAEGLKNMVASCYRCNRMKRDKNKITFVRHMKKVDKWKIYDTQ